MTFDVAFPEKILLLNVFLKSLPGGLPREVLPSVPLQREARVAPAHPDGEISKGKLHVPTVDSGDVTEASQRGGDGHENKGGLRFCRAEPRRYPLCH